MKFNDDRHERDMFERELQKLYHAEVEILDLHGDLASAAASGTVRNIFAGHREDTVEQIHRIASIFEEFGEETTERGSALMEGLLAEKDEFVSEVTDDELDLPDEVTANLEQNRSEAENALEHMQEFLNQKKR